jgi:hypothetical protein
MQQYRAGRWNLNLAIGSPLLPLGVTHQRDFLLMTLQSRLQ